MDFSTYIRILEERLKALGIEERVIENVMAREYATVSEKNTQEIQQILTEDRIEIIVSSTESRVGADMAKRQTHRPVLLDEEKTIAAQSSRKNPLQDEEKTIDNRMTGSDRQDSTIAIPHRVSSIDPEKTMSIQDTKASLSNDEAATVTDIKTALSLSPDTTMVVISDAGKEHLAEEKTVILPKKLEKLLGENETVRISDQDSGAVFPNTATAVKFQENEEATLLNHVPQKPAKTFDLSEADVDKTVPHSTALAKSVSEDTTKIMPDTDATVTVASDAKAKKDSDSLAHDTAKKEEKNAFWDKKEVKVEETAPLSPEKIRNPHPRIAFVWLTLLFLPTFLVLTTLIVAVFLLCNLGFMLSFLIVMILYIGLLLLPLFLALYSAFFAFLYWKDARIADGFLEAGITLFSTGLSLLFGYSLYRLYVRLTDTIGKRFKSFNKKILLLVRNLYRYFLKGAEKL